jgi:hypothetical protein
MRKFFLALAAVTALGIAMPVVSTPADAQNTTVVIKKKKHGDRGLHRGHRKVTVIKSSPRRVYHSHRRVATKVVVKKKRPAARVIVRTN